MSLWNEIDDFKMDEFDSPDEPGSGSKMKTSTILKLQSAREASKRFAQLRDGDDVDCPYIINSGYRTPSHNRKVGGKLNSSHREGHAVDIKCNTSRQRHDILIGLIMAGFTRIGIANSFIHVDDDPKKDPEVIWLYG